MLRKGMLFVQGADKPGIIKTITGVLYQCGANLEDISMTLLEDQFAMMVSFNGSDKSWAAIAAKILILHKKPWNMHTDLITLRPQKNIISRSSKSVLISVIGKDRTGIVYRLSSDLAKLRANITNLDCRLLGKSKSNHFYSMVLEVALPNVGADKKIKKLTRVWQKALKVEVKTYPSESAIF